MQSALSETAKQPEPDDAFLGVARSATGKLWVRRAFDARTAEAIAQSEGIHPALAEIVASRGVSLAEAQGFLAPSLRSALPDPLCLKDMDRAAEALANLIERGDTIGVFGDYDVDGTTSAALMKRYLDALGVPVLVHLPDRESEGYGPNIEAFAGLVEAGAKIIVTVDCGATAHGVLGEAEEKGWGVIVLDHHLMETPPPAMAVVNPNRPDCLSGLTTLSAAGVVFMTMIAVNRNLRARGFFEGRAEPNLLQWLDLVALSHVCDVMPLKGLTRVLVRQGLSVLREMGPEGPGNPGIRALAAAAGAKGRAQASHFGFAIGPRINAAGRIGHAKLAFDLLTTDDLEEADRLAGRLHALNGARQGVEAEVLEAAMRQGEAKGGRDEDGPLIVAGEGRHPGVIGIVAGRLKERFDRPAIVISLEGEGGKGSGRSLGGVDLGEAISAAVAEGVINGGGGHPMAAGLSLTREQRPAFEAFLTQRIGEATRAARANRKFHLDGFVGLGSITRTFCDALQAAGPFGNGNPEPRFAVSEVRLSGLRILSDKHIACTMRDGMGRTARAIAFGCVGQPLGDLLQAAADGPRVHLAGRIKPDDYRGGDNGQFQIEDGAFAD